MSEEQEIDLRSSIAAAIESSEKEAPAPEPAAPQKEGISSEPPQIGSPQEAPQEGRVRDEKGRFVAKDEKQIEIPGTESKPQGDNLAVPQKEEVPTPTKPAQEAGSLRPPANWKPIAKEKWASLPPEVQEEAIRVDKVVSRSLMESNEAREFYGKFRQVAAPYEPMFRALNTDPIQFTTAMAQTMATLTNGAPQQKVDLVADVIQRYGIDLSMLASRLEGGPAAATQAPQPYRDPRVDEIYGMIQQAQQTQAQTLQQQAAKAISEIEHEEFFNDVREDMADILELAARRGFPITPKEAYNRAVALNPETSKVLSQRREAAAAGSPTGPTQRAVAAASSIKPSPAIPPQASSGERSLRDEVAAAWEAALRSR